MSMIRGLELDTTPLYKVDAGRVGREANEGLNRMMGLQRAMQPKIEEPKPTIGQGLMTGLGGAAAGAQIGGPWGAAAGAGIGLLSAFG